MTALDDKLVMAVEDDVGRLTNCLDIKNENDFCFCRALEAGNWLSMSSESLWLLSDMLLPAEFARTGEVISNVDTF